MTWQQVGARAWLSDFPQTCALPSPVSADFRPRTCGTCVSSFRNATPHQISSHWLEKSAGHALDGIFAFMGRQYRLEVEGKECFIDRLLFQRRLRALLAVELKIGEFEPEFVGKMQFYLVALDATVRQDEGLSGISLNPPSPSPSALSPPRCVARAAPVQAHTARRCSYPSACRRGPDSPASRQRRQARPTVPR